MQGRPSRLQKKQSGEAVEDVVVAAGVDARLAANLHVAVARVQQVHGQHKVAVLVLPAAMYE